MDVLTRVNWVDVLALILIIRISYVAFQDGLSHEIFPFLTTIFTITITLHYYTSLGEFLTQGVLKFPLVLANFLAFTALAAVSWVVFKFLKIILDKIIKVQWHPAVEKVGGMVIGIMRSFVVVSLVLILLSVTPLSYLQRSIRERSLTGMYFLQIGYDVYGKTSKILPHEPEGSKK